MPLEHPFVRRALEHPVDRNTTKRFVGSGPLVKLSVHALCAALNLWTSRDAANAAASVQAATVRRMTFKRCNFWVMHSSDGARIDAQ